MKRNTIKVLLLGAMMFMGFGAHAQLETSIFLDGNLPAAEFNNAIDNVVLPMGKTKVGTGATAGIGLGLRVGYHFDIGFGEVTPFLNADLYWNQMRESYRTEYEKQFCDVPNYFNLPIMLGVNYRYPLNDIIMPFAEFAVGSDFFVITQEGWGGANDRPFYRFNNTNTLACQFGIGSYFGNHVSAGLHYYGLGKHIIDYSADDSRFMKNADEFVKRNIGMLVARIGFHF